MTGAAIKIRAVDIEVRRPADAQCEILKNRYSGIAAPVSVPNVMHVCAVPYDRPAMIKNPVSSLSPSGTLPIALGPAMLSGSYTAATGSPVTFCFLFFRLRARQSKRHYQQPAGKQADIGAKRFFRHNPSGTK